MWLRTRQADRLPFLPIEVPDHAKYAAMPREGKGVMCIANHVKPGDKAASQYLSQCAYALQRWHEAFQAAGGKYLKYKLALVTDRDRFEHQVKIDRDFKEFTEIALTHPIFVDDWDGTPQVTALPSLELTLNTIWYARAIFSPAHESNDHEHGTCNRDWL